MKIFSAIKEIWSWHKKLKVQTHDLNYDRDLEPAGWIIGNAYHLNVANIWPKFNENLSRGKEMWRKHKIKHSNSWPTIVIFSRHGWIIGSAHHFTEANNWPIFNEYLSCDKGDMDQTRTPRLKHLTFNCDIGVESAWFGYMFCTSAKAKNWQSLMKNPLKVKGIWRGHEIPGAVPWTLSVTFNLSLPS